MPIEEIAIDMAENWQETTEPGHGTFFEFINEPELEKHVIGYISKVYGWKQEAPDFIRKPEVQKA